MISAFQAARYLLEKQGPEVNIHQLKLNRLIIIAHSWCLAITEKPMLNESIVAYKYGPIILSLWHSLAIQIKNNDVYIPYGVGYQWPDISPVEDMDNPEYKQILDRVWEKYSILTQQKISGCLTLDGGPWDSVWKNRKGLLELGVVEERNDCVVDYTEIPNDLIMLDFKERLDQVK